MNKKIRLLLLSIVFVTVAAVTVFAAGKVIEFVARAEFKTPVLTHTPITNVSSISKNLNAGVIVDFGAFLNATAKAELIYSLDNSANTTVTYSGTIKNNEQFFISTNVGDHNSVKYQIKVSFENSGKTVQGKSQSLSGVFPRPLPPPRALSALAGRPSRRPLRLHRHLRQPALRPSR